jgi:hypothetical protein
LLIAAADTAKLARKSNLGISAFRAGFTRQGSSFYQEGRRVSKSRGAFIGHAVANDRAKFLFCVFSVRQEGLIIGIVKNVVLDGGYL